MQKGIVIALGGNAIKWANEKGDNPGANGKHQKFMPANPEDHTNGL